MNDPRLVEMRLKCERKRGYWENTLRRINKIATNGDAEFEAVKLEWKAAVLKRLHLCQHQIDRINALPDKLEVAERRRCTIEGAVAPNAKAIQITLKRNGRSVTRHLTRNPRTGCWEGWNLPHTKIVVYEGV